MCTVTFIPQARDGFILTSNRDESPTRKTLPPQTYQVNGADLVFPRDELAGGTWFGHNKKGRLICLLNGGFRAHERQASYRMSRGIIVTELLTAADALQTASRFDFHDIEPFTIVLVDWMNETMLHEIVWDGKQAHIEEKSLAPHIWSSSLLYTEEVKQKRKDWFSTFLFETLAPSEDEILKFHRTAGDGNPETDLVMDRGFVKTKSITSFVKLAKTSYMNYEDLETHQATQIAV